MVFCFTLYQAQVKREGLVPYFNVKVDFHGIQKLLKAEFAIKRNLNILTEDFKRWVPYSFIECIKYKLGYPDNVGLSFYFPETSFFNELCLRNDLSLIKSLIIALFQVIGTALLLIVICAAVDVRNLRVPPHTQPLIIGLGLSAIILGFGHNCGAPLNPARDFAPRLFTAVSGWGFEVFR